MADNEIPTNALNASSGFDVSSPDRLEQIGTPLLADKHPDRERYIVQLEDELKELRNFRQQTLRNQQSETSPPVLLPPQPVINTLPPNYQTVVRLAGSLAKARSINDNLLDNDKRMREWTLSQIRENHPRNRDRKRQQPDGSCWCNQCKSRHTGQCTLLTTRCCRCGSFGHIVKDCSYPGNVCWNCKKEGHRVSQCKKKMRGQEVVGMCSSSGQKRKGSSSTSDNTFHMSWYVSYSLCICTCLI